MNESKMAGRNHPAAQGSSGESARASSRRMRAGPSWRSSCAVIATLCWMGCVTDGSQPPAPSQEAASQAQALEPAAPSIATTSPSADGRPPPGVGPKPSVAELKRELSVLPESVLVGTDVVPLADYLGSAAPIPPNGAFESEQGGATAKIRLTGGPQRLALTREFTEPGTRTQTKRYDALERRANGVRVSSTDLEVLGMANAILVLEKHSGVDGIPDSLWIEYGRVPAGAANGK